jgi:hypothetical protein
VGFGLPTFGLAENGHSSWATGSRNLTFTGGNGLFKATVDTAAMLRDNANCQAVKATAMKCDRSGRPATRERDMGKG